jgi:hypothetical protein
LYILAPRTYLNTNRFLALPLPNMLRRELRTSHHMT